MINGLKKAMKILFVCTGNICRSPTAEAVMRAKLTQAGLADRVLVDSAGISGHNEGKRADARSRETASKRGFDMAELRSRPVTQDDFRACDLILAMDKTHRQALHASAPKDSRAKVQLFLEFAAEYDLEEVPDPYYGGADGFESVLDMIEAGCEGLIAHINAKKI